MTWVAGLALLEVGEVVVLVVDLVATVDHLLVVVGDMVNLDLDVLVPLVDLAQIDPVVDLVDLALAVQAVLEALVMVDQVVLGILAAHNVLAVLGISVAQTDQAVLGILVDQMLDQAVLGILVAQILVQAVLGNLVDQMLVQAV